MLNKQEIKKLIEEKGLLSGYIDLDTQLTPNGFDLTCAQVYEFDAPGALDFSNKERKVPQGRLLLPKKAEAQDKHGWYDLPKGAYRIRTNETCAIPLDLVALAFPRSSLLRMGAFTENAVWDAGFKGKSEFILVVENPFGLRLKENARITQLVFVRANETLEGYQGIYQEGK
ncbi:MAG: deoxyuridine 5'-triphosphate nucleotidohydrolase [Candidatus Omnitrophota bacterium]|jgi:dUTP pyrophosphatase